MLFLWLEQVEEPVEGTQQETGFFKAGPHAA